MCFMLHASGKHFADLKSRNSGRSGAETMGDEKAVDIEERSKKEDENLSELATELAEAKQTDILVYNGEIDHESTDELIDLCDGRHRWSNVLFVLTTYGGDPHEAFRIARALQSYYNRFTLFVSGYCKSAGTLIALGAYELVLAKHAELGPIDVQVLKPEEIGDRASALTPGDALQALNVRAMESFLGYFRRLRVMRMPTKMAAETATEMVSGLYQGVYGQLDPMRLGELDRAMRIMLEYGRRLIEVSSNAKPGAVMKLIEGYPDHLFVIDKKEAATLFERTREPDDAELKLVRALDQLVATREPVVSGKNKLLFVNKEKKKEVPHVDPKPDSKGAVGGNSEAKGAEGTAEPRASRSPPTEPSGSS